MAEEIKVVAPLTGGVPVQQSATIQSAKKAQWTAILGTALAFLMTHIDTVQAVAMTVIPPGWYGVATAAVQLATATAAVLYGKQTINGRINATERIMVTKKTSDLNTFLFLLIAASLLFATATARAQTGNTIVFSWQLVTPPEADGFRLYKGKNVSSLVKIGEIPGGAVREYTYVRPDKEAACFGLSSYNVDGESPITFKRDDGVNLCFGKPASPSVIKAKL